MIISGTSPRLQTCHALAELMAIIPQLPQVACHLIQQMSYAGLVVDCWLSDTASRWPHSWPHRLFAVQ